MRTASTLLIATVALFAAACGDDVDEVAEDTEVTAPDDASDDASTDDTSTDEVADDAGVGIGDNLFDPEAVEIASGGTVTWTHEGDIVHNVTFDDGEASETLETGDTYTRTFDEAGTFDYSCTFHPGMDGTVTVG